jgi:6-hydroxycyclohex-1-ene-1-carbonyl-CoA dehydrogenase
MSTRQIAADRNPVGQIHRLRYPQRNHSTLTIAGKSKIRKMMIVPDKITTWQIVEPPVLNKETGKIDPGELELAEIPVPELKAGQVLVKVAGCAICRMVADSTGAQSGIPLTYEISGTVVAGDDAWMGKEVLIPAVLSCGQCDFCVKGHGPCCDNPRTPLNHWQIPSYFSSHIPVSGSSLFEIRHRKRILPLEHLAGVFDALMTPFQALQCASLSSGDPVIVIGVHEMGQYLVQMAKASGAPSDLCIIGR